MLNAVLGRRERGKTTLSYYMVSRVERRMVFDPRGRVQRTGGLIVRTIGELDDAMARLMEGEIREVIYKPSDDDLQMAFRRFAYHAKQWVLEEPTPPLGVMVDEISFVDLEEPAFQWLLKCSPGETVHVFLTGHRPADIPTNVRSITNRWFLFHCRQEHDLDVIRKRCSPEVADCVMHLEGRECILWDDERARMVRYTDERSWFVDIAPKGYATGNIDVDGGVEVVSARRGLFDK